MRSPGRDFLDRPNLNQMHPDAVSYKQFCLVYSGYGPYQGQQLRVILEANPLRAYDNLVYVRGQQLEHGSPLDARLESRVLSAGPWNAVSATADSNSSPRPSSAVGLE